MVRIPKKVKIGIIWYKIVEKEMTCGAMGELDRHTNTIYINKNISQEQKFNTLLHEILHAINGEIIEPIIESFANGLSQVLKDNGLWK